MKTAAERQVESECGKVLNEVFEAANSTLIVLKQKVLGLASFKKLPEKERTQIESLLNALPATFNRMAGLNYLDNSLLKELMEELELLRQKVNRIETCTEFMTFNLFLHDLYNIYRDEDKINSLGPSKFRDFKNKHMKRFLFRENMGNYIANLTFESSSDLGPNLRQNRLMNPEKVESRNAVLRNKLMKLALVLRKKLIIAWLDLFKETKEEFTKFATDSSALGPYTTKPENFDKAIETFKRQLAETEAELSKLT